MQTYKILIITNGNYFAKIILEGLFDQYTDSIIGVLVITGDYKGQVGLKSLWALGQQTAFPYLVYKIITILFFRTTALLMKNRILDVARLARARNIPVWHYVSINSPSAIERAQGLRPDAIISVSCPQLIKKSILSFATIGNINIHSSLLPIYAGLAPYYWVLANGEKETGTTVHIMTPKFDEGNVLSQESIEIQKGESAFHLFLRLATAGKDVLVEGLGRMLKGDQGIPQDHSKYTYFSNPSFASYLSLRKRGHVLMRLNELIDVIR